MVEDVINHLSFIHQDHALFGATTWPAFVAGAETDDPAQRGWVERHFVELWEVQPWNNITAAVAALQKVWSTRDKDRSSNWIQIIRNEGVDWIIL